MDIVDMNTGRDIRDTNVTPGTYRDLLASEDTTLSTPSRAAYVSGSTVTATVKDAVLNEGSASVTLNTTDVIVSGPLSGGRLTGPITYATSDPTIATVNGSGIITPHAPGTCIINVNCPGLNNRAVTLNVIQTAGQTTYQFANFAAGSLGAHLVSQINGLLGTTPPPTDLNSAPAPPARGPYGNLYMFNEDGTRNADVWTGTLDTTCIARNAWGTLITPDAVVMAAHTGPVVGGQFTFVDMAGNATLVTLTALSAVAGGVGDGGDVMVGKITPALGAGYTPAKLLPANYASYLPQAQYAYPTLATTQDKTLLLMDVVNFEQPVNLSGGGTTTDIYLVQSSDPTRAAWYNPCPRYLDSGSPVFMVINNALVLLTLWHYSGGLGPNYADQLNVAGVNKINAALTAVGSAYTVTTANLAGFPTY